MYQETEKVRALCAPRKLPLDWSAIIGLIIMHVGFAGVFFPQLFSWSAVILAIVLYITAGLFGITVGYHRLLTHRSFKVPYWLECCLTLCACLGLQGGSAQWVGTHRLHHSHADDEKDPHSPRDGWWWAHIWWTCYKGNRSGVSALKAAPDLMRDPFHRFLTKYFWLPQVIVTVLLLVIGSLLGGVMLALSWFVWAVCLRTVVMYHVTWCVNSASHYWGYQSYETGDDSRNLWWVALLSFGEGWHNNHHYKQYSARHGFKWYEVDPAYWVICTFRRLGLAWDIRLP